jgi:hypothetical protein
MLCVEAAAVQTPITLAAGGRWHGTQTLDTAVRMATDTETSR